MQRGGARMGSLALFGACARVSQAPQLLGWAGQSGQQSGVMSYLHHDYILANSSTRNRCEVNKRLTNRAALTHDVGSTRLTYRAAYGERNMLREH